MYWVFFNRDTRIRLGAFLEKQRLEKPETDKDATKLEGKKEAKKEGKKEVTKKEGKKAKDKDERR